MSPTILRENGYRFFIFSRDKEYFLSYEDFLWFKDASIGKVFNVEEPTLGHFYWPDLDVDIGIESIENPDKYAT